MVTDDFLTVNSYIRDHLMSDEFLDFFAKNRVQFKQMLSYYNCAIMEVETKFRVLNEQLSLQYDRNPIEGIKSRIKSVDSLIQKIQRRNVSLDFSEIENQITDIAGVRIICSYPDDIYLLSDALLRQDDITLYKKKDYFQNPKANGYRSLHLIIEVPIFLMDEKKNVKVEVQFRTIAMDFWASLEHKVRYKKNLPDHLTKELESELLACSEIAASLDLRMQAIREKIVNDPDFEVHSSYSQKTSLDAYENSHII